MEFREYQIRATTTDQNPKISWNKRKQKDEPTKEEIIPLIGMVGEVGGLLSEYKKMLRDGAIYEEFPKQVKEELGDILWYVAIVATKFGLNLDKIAQDNLKKNENRWYEPNQEKPLYDENCQEDQKLPRIFSYDFSNHVDKSGIKKLILKDSSDSMHTGDPLTDNAYENDGYRYHDVMHLAFMAKLGWSPVFRKLLRSRENEKKLRHRKDVVDDAEDGGRAQIIEEAIIVAAYVYAEKRAMLEGTNAVDWQLLRHIQKMTSKLEVRNRTAWEWNDALMTGFTIWRKLIKHEGGTVKGDLNKRTLVYIKSFTK